VVEPSEAAPSGAKSASKLENDVSAEKETSGAVGFTKPLSIVEQNLLTRRGYSPYCLACSSMPRMRFDGRQFACPACKNRTKFEREFMAQVVAFNATPPHQERAEPSPTPAEPLQGAHAPPIDPAPSPGVQTISGACHNGGSSPSKLCTSNSDTPPTTTNTPGE